MASYSNLQAFVDKDGNVIDCPALKYITITEKGNLQITTPEGAKFNLEASDNMTIKPGGTLQLDTAHYVTETDRDKFVVKTINDDGDVLEGLELCTADLSIKNNKADATFWDAAKFVLRILKKKDTWMKAIQKAASWDIRGHCQDSTKAMKPGSGGGIAIQIAGCDSNFKENKFKIETDRIVDINNTTPTTRAEAQAMYNGEGGNGIEIGTINSKMTSLYTGSYRFKRNAPIYAVTRGELVTTGDKTDYPTQADDSKDILPADFCTWRDIVAAVKFLKDNGSIPSEYADDNEASGNAGGAVEG